MIIRAVLGFFLAITITSGSHADPLEDGTAAYDAGDYALALNLLRPLAEQGDDLAKQYLAEMYLYGRGVPQSDADFLDWYPEHQPPENWWLVRDDNDAQHRLAFTACDPESEPWFECGGFVLACGDVVFPSFDGLAITSDLRSVVIVRRLIESSPYHGGEVDFTIGTVSAGAKIHAFEAAYSDLNSAWDVTVGFTAANFFNILESSSSPVEVIAEVVGVTLNLMPRTSDWPILVEFARSCVNR